MVHAFVGENDVARDDAQASLTRSFVAEHGDMAIERLDGEEVSYEQILASVRSLPFLASKKLILLRSPSACKDFIEQFSDFTDEIADTNDVLIVESKLDKRLSYYKSLKKLEGFREYSTLDFGGLTKFAMEFAKAHGAQIGYSEAKFLVERVGTNQLIVQSEIEKLALLGPKIELKNIELMVEATPQSSIFDLLQAAFTGNHVRALELYEEQRAMKVEPNQIIAMLVWQLHLLALVKSAKGKPASEVANDLKSKPISIEKSMRLAETIPVGKLKKLISGLLKIDENTKTKEVIADEALKYYLLSI